LRIRLIFSLGAAALAAALGLAAPTFASSMHFQTGAGKGLRGTHTENNPSTAGYETNSLSASTISMTTTFVVPAVKHCGNARKAIIPFIGSGNGDVGLDLHCRHGKVINFPIFAADGHIKADAAAHAHPGDTIVLRLTWNATRLSLYVIDTTHPSVTRTLTGAGSSSSFTDAAIGDSVIGSPPPPVPDFGKVTFTKSKINGRALGLTPGLIRDNLVNSSHVLQIKTGPIASNNESFTTTFKHS
jgi:Peptidase A4 family